MELKWATYDTNTPNLLKRIGVALGHRQALMGAFVLFVQTIFMLEPNKPFNRLNKLLYLSRKNHLIGSWHIIGNKTIGLNLPGLLLRNCRLISIHFCVNTNNAMLLLNLQLLLNAYESGCKRSRYSRSIINYE